MCNCKWTESIIAIVILVFTFWWNMASTWVIAIGAVALLLHAWMCKSCMMCNNHAMGSKMMSKKRRR